MSLDATAASTLHLRLLNASGLNFNSQFVIPRLGTTELTGTGIVRRSISWNAATVARPSVLVQSSEINWGTLPSDINISSIDNYVCFNTSAQGTGSTLWTRTLPAAISISPGGRLFLPAGTTTLSLGTNADPGFTAAHLASLLDYAFRSASPPSVPSHLGLLNNGVELSGTGYARVSVLGWWTAPTLADPSLSNSGSARVFTAAAGGAWGPANQWGLWTASTAGTLLFTGTLATPVNIGAGDPVNVPAGSPTTGLRFSVS